MDHIEVLWYKLKLPWYKLFFHPMVLSLFRCCAVSFIYAYLCINEVRSAIMLWAIAEFTDLMDGILARRWGLTSTRGARFDTWADKLLHVPLFCYFLVLPRPDLPHYFLFREILARNWVWVGLFCFGAILVMEVLLALSRTKHLKRFRKSSDDKANIKGKRKTWVHALCLLAYMIGQDPAALCYWIRDWAVMFVTSKIAVTAAQGLLALAIVLGFISLRSRLHLRRLIYAVGVGIRAYAESW